MKCKECKHWDYEHLDAQESFSHMLDYLSGNIAAFLRAMPCTHPHFIYESYDRDEYPLDALLYADYEGHKAYCKTGPHFGCIHFEVTDQDRSEYLELLNEHVMKKEEEE
jgi:hypothetical protein